MHCSPPEVNPLPVAQQLGEVGLIGSGIGGAGQLTTAAASASETALRGRRPRFPWASAAAPSLR